MADKEHLVRCDLREYFWARDSGATVMDLTVEAQDMWLYLRRKDVMGAVKGPVRARRVLGELSVVITLLNADMKETDKVYHGSMTNRFWNPDSGSPGILFEHDLDEDETCNGVLRPYTDGFGDEKLMHESTGIDATDDELPPDFFS